MVFDSEADALHWFESEERTLTKDYLDNIPWEDVKKYSVAPELIPVITYMRDIEVFTELYYQQLLRSPTGKDPNIRRFMDRWADEEPLHGHLLNRFMGEAGYPTEDDWVKKAKKSIPIKFHVMDRIQAVITAPFGLTFSAVHMTWGAINEHSAMASYKRLTELAKHPVLSYILKGIIPEEGRHGFYYWSIARLRLKHSKIRQSLARYIVEKFWAPVGSGAKSDDDVNLVVKTLFKDQQEGKLMNVLVDQPISRLPGFEGLDLPSKRVAAIAA